MAVTDGSGTGMHVYNYDDIYQITEVNYPAGYEDVFTDTTYNYDAAGNRTSVIDAGGTSSYVTNALNQYTAVGGAAYVHDDNGNMTYDGDGMMYAYDPENRLTTVTKLEGPLSAACDIALPFTTSTTGEWFAQTTESSYGNSAVQSGDIGDSQETWIEATVTSSGYLTFDYKLSAQSGDSFALFIDDQYRSGRNGSCDWTESGPHAINGAGTHTIRWKFIKDSSGSEGSDCLWIDHVRWTGSMPDMGDFNVITYVYDASGRRIEKKYDGATQVKYVYDGHDLVAEYDGSNNLLRKYVHGSHVDEPICMIEAAGSYTDTYYYHFDALGSVMGLTNSAGNMVELYEYSVYGQVAASDPNHPNRFMFTGREFDKDTGLYYYRARYYHPEVGRFLQADQIGYGAGMNLYRYCVNNPWNVVDPLGNDPCVGFLPCDANHPCGPNAPDSNSGDPCDCNDSDPCDPCDPCAPALGYSAEKKPPRNNQTACQYACELAAHEMTKFPSGGCTQKCSKYKVECMDAAKKMKEACMAKCKDYPLDTRPGCSLKGDAKDIYEQCKKGPPQWPKTKETK